MKSAASSILSILIVLALVFLSVPVLVPVEAQTFSCSNVTEIPQLECEALVALYNSTSGDGWEDNTNWLGTITPSNWEGVTASGGHVTEIELQSNNLVGSMPPELGNLTALQYLDLSYNVLRGSIPPELGNLTALQYLDLGNHGFHSWLTSDIPPELGNLTALQYLDLSWNSLPGTIPPELGNLAALERLDLSWNSLSGSIPPELGNLAMLQSLYLSDNSLSGSIPPELGNLDALRSLVLSNNALSGSIPPELGSLPSLLSLILSSNHLTGSIPPELGNLRQLVSLHIHYNSLTGSIPPELGNLVNLEWLTLEENQLTGNIPPELGALPSFYHLDLHSNELTGSIPPELGSLLLLERLYLWDNQLTGSIPRELGNLTRLGSLHLEQNQLTGGIPLTFVNLSHLGSFHFYETDLCEPTTDEYLIWKDTVAQYEGTDVDCDVFSCSTVTEVPEIECEALVGLYSDTRGDFWAYNTNWLVTNTPSNWHGVTVTDGQITHIDLSSNKLSGSLPADLGSLSALQHLTLEDNSLSVRIPLTFANLSQLNTFHFFETDLCEPTSPEYLAWKDTVADYQGTGESCQAPRAWTLMYYQAGDSTAVVDGVEKDYGDWLLKESEYLEDGSNNPNLNIVILRDTLSSGGVYEAYVDGQPANYLSRGEPNMGDAATLSEFVNWAKLNFPADHYALIMVGHGHGLKGSSQDLTNKTQPEDFLDPKEFRQALEASFPFDVIFMEACLLANLEHAYQARWVSDYYVASEAQFKAPFSHGYLAKISSETSEEQLAILIAEAYYAQNNNTGLKRTISVGDMSKIDQVAESTNALAALRPWEVGLAWDIYDIISGDVVQRFDDDLKPDDSEDPLADLYHFAELVAALGDPELTTAANNVMAAIDEYIVWINPPWEGDDDPDFSNAHGLSVILTTKLACYYDLDVFDFAGDVSWFCNPETQAMEQAAGEWGQMLSDLIWEFDPDPERQYEPPPLVPVDVSPVEVAIAIQPSGHPSAVNCSNDKAMIEVAILTTDAFDAITVDHTTVTFEGATETRVDKKTGLPKRYEEDIDGDGDLDLVFNFRFGDTRLTCDSTEATLVGETYNEVSIRGSDRIKIVGR